MRRSKDTLINYAINYFTKIKASRRMSHYSRNSEEKRFLLHKILTELLSSSKGISHGISNSMIRMLHVDQYINAFFSKTIITPWKYSDAYSWNVHYQKRVWPSIIELNNLINKLIRMISETCSRKKTRETVITSLKLVLISNFNDLNLKPTKTSALLILSKEQTFPFT